MLISCRITSGLLISDCSARTAIRAVTVGFLCRLYFLYSCPCSCSRYRKEGISMRILLLDNQSIWTVHDVNQPVTRAHCVVETFGRGAGTGRHWRRYLTAP